MVSSPLGLGSFQHILVGVLILLLPLKLQAPKTFVGSDQFKVPACVLDSLVQNVDLRSNTCGYVFGDLGFELLPLFLCFR